MARCMFPSILLTEALLRRDGRFYNCSLVTNGETCSPNAPISQFQFQTGKTHKIRLINAGAEGNQNFAIDGHTMTVIANDFVPVLPYQTDVVTLATGQRTDVLVNATGKATDAFWMRSNISTLCSIPRQPYALAAVYYPEANTSIAPTSTAIPFEETSCGNVSSRS